MKNNKDNSNGIRILSSLSFMDENGKGMSCELVTKSDRFYVVWCERKNFDITLPVVCCKSNCDFDEAWKIYLGAVEDCEGANFFGSEALRDCTKMRYTEGKCVGTPEEKEAIAYAIKTYDGEFDCFNEERVKKLVNPAEDELSNELSYPIVRALAHIIRDTVIELEEEEVKLDDIETKLADSTDADEKNKLAVDLSVTKGAIAYKNHVIEECRRILFRKKEDKRDA